MYFVLRAGQSNGRAESSERLSRPGLPRLQCLPTGRVVVLRPVCAPRPHFVWAPHCMARIHRYFPRACISHYRVSRPMYLGLRRIPAGSFVPLCSWCLSEQVNVSEGEKELSFVASLLLSLLSSESF